MIQNVEFAFGSWSKELSAWGAESCPCKGRRPLKSRQTAQADQVDSRNIRVDQINSLLRSLKCVKMAVIPKRLLFFKLDVVRSFPQVWEQGRRNESINFSLCYHPITRRSTNVPWASRFPIHLPDQASGKQKHINAEPWNWRLRFAERCPVATHSDYGHYCQLF